jgi:plasmid stabilization system protein ParE
LAALRFAPAALEDFERLAAFLLESDPGAVAETIPLILEGLKLLASHPLIGRPIAADRRELLIFRGRSGYFAQYSFRLASDEVVILAIRHQREMGH